MSSLGKFWSWYVDLQNQALQSLASIRVCQDQRLNLTPVAPRPRPEPIKLHISRGDNHPPLQCTYHCQTSFFNDDPLRHFFHHQEHPNHLASFDGFHNGPPLRLHPHSLNPLPHHPHPHPPPCPPSFSPTPTIPPPQFNSRPWYPPHRRQRAPVSDRKGKLDGEVEGWVE